MCCVCCCFCCLLLVDCCLLIVVCRVLFVGCCLLRASLCGVCWFIVCVLDGVHGLLFVVFRCSLLFVGLGCLVLRCVVFDVGFVFVLCCLLFAVRGLVLCSWLVVCCLLIVAC